MKLDWYQATETVKQSEYTLAKTVNEIDYHHAACKPLIAIHRHLELAKRVYDELDEIFFRFRICVATSSK